MSEITRLQLPATLIATRVDCAYSICTAPAPSKKPRQLRRSFWNESPFPSLSEISCDRPGRMLVRQCRSIAAVYLAANMSGVASIRLRDLTMWRQRSHPTPEICCTKNLRRQRRRREDLATSSGPSYGRARDAE